MWLGLAVSYYILLCRAPEPSDYTVGKVRHRECCSTRACPTSSRGVQVEHGNRSSATALQIRFAASKHVKQKEQVHDYPYAAVEQGGGVYGALRGCAGIARRASPSARGGAADSTGHVTRLENFL